MHKYEKREEGKLYMKKFLSFITAMVMIFCLMPPVRSFAEDMKTVEYIDYVSDGNGGFIPQKKTAECKVIQGDNETLELSTGWYLSDGIVSVSERVSINGDVHLILSRSSNGSGVFTAQNGIRLTDNNILSIYDMYAENADPGKMSVYTSSPNRNAAIGGNTDFHGGENCGTLNIYGGIINVEKYEHAAIGGGSSTETGDAGNGGTVNVYGGKLTATARYNSLTPAIGGGATREGRSGDGTKLNVYGGEVNAVSYDHTAIGKGNIYSGKGTLGENGKTYISGGSVSTYVYGANSKGAAFDHVPTFDANYEYNLFCGNSDQDPSKADPTDKTIYTAKKYVMIEGLYTDVQFNDYSWDGSKIVKNSSIARCKKLSANDFPDVLTSGCYYIDSTINTPDKTLTIDGDVKLIAKSVSSSLYVKNIILPKGSSLACCGVRITLEEGISGQNGNGGTFEANSGKINTSGKIDLSSLIIYTGNIEVCDKLTCSDIRMYGSEYDNNCFSGILVINNGASLSSAPAFINYIPKVIYIDVGERLSKTVVDPPSSFYTEKYDMLIINMERAGTNTPACDHSGNINPTCEGAKCSVCGEYIAPTGHKNGDPVIENETEAVCEIGGSYDEVIYCSVCGKELSRETKTVEAKGHIPAEPVIENQTAAVCTEGGSYDEVVYCSVCKKELSRVTKTTEALGHIEGEWEVISAPTTTSVGTRVIKCKVCGEILKTETIPQIIINIPQIPANIPTEKPSEVVYTEFPELNFSIEIKDGKAIISWDKVENVNKYVVYAIRDGKLTELEKTQKTEFETKHTSGTGYLVRYMKNGVLSPKAKSMNEGITSDKPMVTAISDKNSVTLRWQDMGAEKYNIYKYVDGKAVKIGSVNGTSVKIKNLYADTEYKFIVTAVIDGKEAAMMKSDIVTVKTKKI